MHPFAFHVFWGLKMGFKVVFFKLYHYHPCVNHTTDMITQYRYDLGTLLLDCHWIFVNRTFE